MDNTPRLKNLLKKRRELLALTDSISHLSDEDEFLIERIPNIVYLNNFADHIAEIVRTAVRNAQKAALPANQAVIFCAICEDDAEHQRIEQGRGVSRYKCTRCGTVGGEL